MPPRRTARPIRTALLPLAALLACGALAACGPQDPPPPAAPRATTQGPSYGTVIGARPAGGHGPAPALPGTAELTVREDSGGELQVVQPDREGLREGDRVLVSRGNPTRLSRAATGTGTGTATARAPARPAPARAADAAPDAAVETPPDGEAR